MSADSKDHEGEVEGIVRHRVELGEGSRVLLLKGRMLPRAEDADG